MKEECPLTVFQIWENVSFSCQFGWNRRPIAKDSEKVIIRYFKSLKVESPNFEKYVLFHINRDDIINIKIMYTGRK